MNEIIQAVLMALTMIVTLAVYAFLVKVIIPGYVVKRKYYIDGNLGRGLRKYKSEDGRAIIYEPHPSIRKYIKQYALVCDGGHKYLECNMDRGVNRLIYTVIMLDRNDKVIDALEVEEVTAKRDLTQVVYLHPDTSYVAIIVGSVNKEKLQNSDVSYYTVKDIGIMAGAVSGLTLIASLVFLASLESFLFNLGANYISGGSFIVSLLAAIVVGGLSVAAMLSTCSKKNVRILKK